ncbi:hypothetical protein ESOMN_v1c07130 [Williamsoniiplasma somnilux]|uniref:DUF1904 domain-containing protein n=1 Tax=Williamsoniiplasma somnilux TaxID=215578 RepID=A0A2K8NZ50_9MOLU|nr:DUF1904 family protein [Williamsoniiplasma somnilux]ATZ19095.1 hypothetical protein ESOMN_v1c07130 [Williamsoniiplasma somnilux]
MPIIKFSGVTQQRVEEYAKKIDEIAELIVAKSENIMFIYEGSKIYPIKDGQSSIYISVEWMSRVDKEQLLTNHLVNFFKNDSDKVGVFFTDMNNKWYMNGNKIG